MTTDDSGIRAYIATMTGTWTPLTMVNLPPATFPLAQAAATQATRLVLGVQDNSIDFHTVATDEPGGPVYRSRWRVEAWGSGPALRPGTPVEHDSAISLMMRVYPHSQRRQVVIDETMPKMPYRGVFSGVIPALLLRHLWGTAGRTLTVGTYGTGTFTPIRLQYDDVFDNPPPYDLPVGTDESDIVSYWFTQASHDRPPGMWLRTEEPIPTAWQVSYCVDSPEKPATQRWDAPQPIPAFTPLEWPPPPEPFTWPTPGAPPSA